MNYVYKEENGINVYKIHYDISINMYLENIANTYFRSIESIKKITRKKTGITRNIPIYISRDIILIQVSRTRNVDSFFFNYLELENYIIKDDKTILFFKNKEIFNLTISRFRMNELINKAKTLINYLTLFD